MRKIRIWADVNSTGVMDSEIGSFFARKDTGISETTWAELQQWVADYAPIIPMSTEQRKTILRTIHKLDSIGLTLMEKIKKEWTQDLQTGNKLSFEYYSEGLSTVINTSQLPSKL